MYYVMQSMTRTSQQVRRGVLELVGKSYDFPARLALRAGLHCGGKEYVAESNPLQAENPAKFERR